MRVLVACECSGVVRDAFRKLGHDAWSCDLAPCDADPTYHIQDDVLNHINDGWDLMIAHPPCTYLANSGVCRLTSKTFINPTRWKQMEQGAALFTHLLNAPIKYIAVENPIMHCYAKDLIKVPPTQIIQPSNFGHPESKATCLWLKNLKPLIATSNFCGANKRLSNLAPSKDRAKERSKTFQGIADAMAKQWTEWIAYFEKK